jgi:hypothetical protein
MMKLFNSSVQFIGISLLYSDRPSTAGRNLYVREYYSPILVTFVVLRNKGCTVAFLFARIMGIRNGQRRLQFAF